MYLIQRINPLHNNCSFLYSMSAITYFDDLPDLVLLEVFLYLSPIDILWAFINLNHRIQAIMNERSLFRQINLSRVHRSKFEALRDRLPLNQIETLTIDIEASTVQLPRWSYLPRLTKLRLFGLRDFADATRFILRHAHSLTHLTLETSDRLMSLGFTGCILQPPGRLVSLVENVLPHLSALRSLDLGHDIGLGLHSWNITTIKYPLQYLRVPMQDVIQLCEVISVEPLSTALEQLHVTIRDHEMMTYRNSPKELSLNKMIHLHTFTLVQTIFTDSKVRWSVIETITAPTFMPVLRKVNIAIFIKVDEFKCISQSAVFTDDRRIDVQFAFIISNPAVGISFTQDIPHGSRSHPRQIVGVTCVASYLNPEYSEQTDVDCYYDKNLWIYDVWYTLPWTFEPFFDMLKSYSYITKVEPLVTPASNSSIIYPSQLRVLTVAQNRCFPSIVSMPHVVQTDHIDTVHLGLHDWPTGLNLPSVRHVIMKNNLAKLKDFSSFPITIRTIEIIFDTEGPNVVPSNWCVLRSLSALPMLTSLRIELNDTATGLDDTDCQIIAETVPLLVHLSIIFRSRYGLSEPGYIPPSPAEIEAELLQLLAEDPTLIIGEADPHAIGTPALTSRFEQYQASIEEIHRRILCLASDKQPLIVLEEGGCGLTVWM